MAKPGKAQKWAARSARLKTALRENLKKRKQQGRARARSRDIEQTADPALPGQGPDFRRNQGAN